MNKEYNEFSENELSKKVKLEIGYRLDANS